MIVHVLPLQENCRNCQHHIEERVNKCDLWEDRPYAHRIAMGRSNSAEKGELNRAGLEDIDRYGKFTTICPVGDS